MPYILDEFGSYFFETPYDTTDKNFPECDIDRPAGASAQGRMSIVNHFLDFDILGIKVPDQIDAARTNSVSSILAQADICYAKYGKMPNFILVSRDKPHSNRSQSSSLPSSLRFPRPEGSTAL